MEGQSPWEGKKTDDSPDLKRDPSFAAGRELKLRAMIGAGDVAFGSHLFSVVIGIADNLLDLLNYSPRTQNTTDDTVSEGDQSHAPDDQAHEIVEREQQQDSDDQPPPPSL